jgi:hypothetical protein
MRREPSQVFGIGYVVYHGRCFPKGSVNMRWTDKFGGTAHKSRGSKYRKRVEVIKFQDGPAMNNAKPSGNTTKNSVVAATDAIESLLLALFAIFLITPTAINRENGIWLF